MGMELKQMTLQDEANEDGDNSEEESKQDMTVHRNDAQWVQFCNSGNLMKYEKLWTTRLEDYKREEKEEDQSEE
jgi:hypothetical protein